MSLISQCDHQVAIKALEHYIQSYDLDSNEKTEALALLNWIRLNLEKYKSPDNS